MSPWKLIWEPPNLLGRCTPIELKGIFLEIVYLDLYSDKVWVFRFFHFAHPQAIFTDGRSQRTLKKKKKKKNGWTRPLLRMIIMIIAELSGRCRQSPIVLGGEGQSLGTKDALSIGPLDTHWSHVFINPVRCIYIGNSCFAEAYKLNTDLRSNAGCVSNAQSNNYTKLIFNSSCRELSNDSKQAVDRMLLSTKFVAWANY